MQKQFFDWRKIKDIVTKDEAKWVINIDNDLYEKPFYRVKKPKDMCPSNF